MTLKRFGFGGSCDQNKNLEKVLLRRDYLKKRVKEEKLFFTFENIFRFRF